MTQSSGNTTDRTDGLRVLRAEYEDGHEIGNHDHAWSQLVYAAAGAIHVATPARTWLIPPARAVWLPPLASHSLRMRGRTRLRTIYVPPERCAGLGGAEAGLFVTALLRERILALTRYTYVEMGDPLAGPLAAAFLAALAVAEPLSLVLTRPSSPAALKVASAIEADPGRDVTLTAWRLRTGRAYGHCNVTSSRRRVRRCRSGDRPPG